MAASNPLPWNPQGNTSLTNNSMNHPHPSFPLIGRLAFIAACIPTLAAAVAPPELWYQQQAAKWSEALPIGNGRMCAMVFGG